MSRSVTLALAAAVFIGALTFPGGARPARADHYLGATVKWVRDSTFIQDPTRRRINLAVTYSWRASWQNLVPVNPSVGAMITPNYGVEVLDKNGASLGFYQAPFIVDSVNAADDWLTVTGQFQLTFPTTS